MRSDTSEPSRRMIGSMLAASRGVRASGGSSVELEAERSEGLEIGMELGGWWELVEVLLAVEAVETLRIRAAVAEESGLSWTG